MKLDSQFLKVLFPCGPHLELPMVLGVRTAVPLTRNKLAIPKSIVVIGNTHAILRWFCSPGVTPGERYALRSSVIAPLEMEVAIFVRSRARDLTIRDVENDVLGYSVTVLGRHAHPRSRELVEVLQSIPIMGAPIAPGFSSTSGRP